MVNSVSSVNILNQASKSSNQAEIKKLASYVNNEALKQIPDTFASTTKSGIKSSGLFNGIPYLFFLKNKFFAKKLFSDNIKAMNNVLIQGDKATIEAFKGIFKKGGKLTEKIANYTKAIDANDKLFSGFKKATKLSKNFSIASKKADKIAAKLNKNTGNKFINWIRNKRLDKFTAKAEQFKAAASEATNGVLNKTVTKAAEEGTKKGLFSKVFTKIGSKVGNNKAVQLFKKSGAGFMLAFSGIMETATEIIPTFKELGKEKGMKQVGKSAIKVVGDTAGFIAGQAVGKFAGGIIGAKIGTALGSIAPGIGNVIGGAIGFIGGMLGSFIAGKITKKITGPTERELAKQQQINKDYKKANNNKQSLEALKEAAAAKIQNELETTGKLSEDSYIALESLSKLEGQNPFAAKA